MIVLASAVVSLQFIVQHASAPTLPNSSSTAASGSQFNHVVIIAMENQNYGSVIGSSSAPFINSLAKLGTSISNYHSYGQNINGCSAGCYEAFTSGQQSHSDGWCPRASSPCYTIPNIADQLHNAGLSTAMFCEDGCPRGADHFPWIAYASTWNSCVTGSFTCNGQTGPDGNLLYGSSSNTGNSAFINYLNSASPANYIWFTPTDIHNMHDNSVSSGDAYLQALLVGTGTLGNPAPGSVLASNLFKTAGTFLYLWWDEYDPSPNVEYGSMIKAGYTSTGGYDEYDSLHTIESNWGLPYITSTVSSDTGITDVFGITAPPALSATFIVSPQSPTANSLATFTPSVMGGLSPYAYLWSFGDGSTSSASSPTHTYTLSGSYTISLSVTDTVGTVAKSSQTLTVNPPSSILVASFTFTPSNPDVNNTVTFTGSGTGGIPPYSYLWTLGDGTTSNGQSTNHVYTSAINATVTLTVSDTSHSTAKSTRTIQVARVVSSPPQGIPVIVGFGGLPLNEVHQFTRGNPSSQAFPGQQASDMEYAMMTLQSRGLDGVRVSFDPPCATAPYPLGASYSAADLSLVIQIASRYNLWVIVDYHGFTDPFTTTTSQCWLSFWLGVVSEFGNSYTKLVWEPENEPKYGFTGAACSGATSCVAYLSGQYQLFINQTRQLGDTHWIVVQNVCSYGCSFCPDGNGDCAAAVNGYPTVRDPLHRVFISLHSYMSPTTTWTNATADADANAYYSVVVTGMAKTGWPSLNTDGGAGQILNLNPPGIVLAGMAGYTNVTLRFIQTLTTLYDTNKPQRIGYLWSPAGDNSNTSGAGALGALQCNSTPQGWGCLLQTVAVPLQNMIVANSSGRSWRDFIEL